MNYFRNKNYLKKTIYIFQFKNSLKSIFIFYFQNSFENKFAQHCTLNAIIDDRPILMPNIMTPRTYRMHCIALL